MCTAVWRSVFPCDCVRGSLHISRSRIESMSPVDGGCAGRSRTSCVRSAGIEAGVPPSAVREICDLRYSNEEQMRGHVCQIIFTNFRGKMWTQTNVGHTPVKQSSSSGAARANPSLTT